MLTFIGGATCGLAMSSLLWFGLTVLLDVSSTRASDTCALHPAIRRVIGIALTVLGLSPLLYMFEEQSWPAMQGYATATVALPLLVLIQILRGAE